MPDTGSRRLALYNGLSQVLGSELADTLMNYLPASDASELATRADLLATRADLKADIGRVEAEIGRLETNVTEMKDDIRYLSQRMDRLQQTTLAGFVAMFAALIASGFLG